VKAFFELLGFLVERLTGTRKKGTRRLPRDSRRTRIVGVLAIAAAVAVALAVFGLTRSADEVPSTGSPGVAAPTNEVTAPGESGSPVKPIQSTPAHTVPTTSRATAETTETPQPSQTEARTSVPHGVRKGASCTPEGAVGFTDAERRVTCQGPGRLRWR
jgi:hypothetical protein